MGSSYDPTLYKAISTRRNGIVLDVVPVSRQSQEGYVDTFEEGQQIVTDLYAKVDG